MEKQAMSLEAIVPGMLVEATQGDLGDTDVSPPRVVGVQHDANGRIDAIEVAKGILFHKKLWVPASRIQAVEFSNAASAPRGKVKVNISEQELEALAASGVEETLHPQPQEDLLDQVEQQIPTEQGLRELEENIHVDRPPNLFWRIIGPGFLAGLANNDPSAITAYAINGATVGTQQLWLMLLSTPLLQAVQFACAKIGRISQKGISQLLREYYGKPMAVLASLLLSVINIALIAADLVAVGSGLELISGLSWVWFVTPVALLLWYLTVYGSFEAFKKAVLAMSFVFVAYILAAFVSHADWKTVLVQTFVPHLNWTFETISNTVAILGATISPYAMFWQAQGETEQQRDGSLKRQLREAEWDVTSGIISAQLVVYFVIVTTASTLFAHHTTINTAADAARALEPLVGPVARYLFAIGLIGSGMVALPILVSSTSYAVAGAIGWPSGLSKRPWQSEGFYLIQTVALALGLGIALLRINPIQLIFWANVLSGIIAPLIVLAILLVGNNRTIMRGQRLNPIHNFGLVLIVLIMIAAAVLLFYSLVTGRRS